MYYITWNATRPLRENSFFSSITDSGCSRWGNRLELILTYSSKEEAIQILQLMKSSTEKQFLSHPGVVFIHPLNMPANLS